MSVRWTRCLRQMAAAAGMLALAGTAFSQAQKSASEYDDSKVDIFAGWGDIRPLNSGINGFQYQENYKENFTGSGALYFRRNLGVQVEGSLVIGPTNAVPCADLVTGSTGNCVTHSQHWGSVEAGPIVRLPLGPFVPFIHALGGGVYQNGPANQPLTWGWGVTGGGGVDYVLPWWNKRIAYRPIQADWQYSQVTYGPLILPAGINGGFGEMSTLKLTTGVVFRSGMTEDKHPVTLGCTAEPVSVHPGEPVNVTGSTLYLNPKHKAFWTWTTNGGRLTQTDSNAVIDTTGMTPGGYTVEGHVEQGKRASQQASCSTPFTVRPWDPPTVTCSAVPSSVAPGTDVQITTTGTSPQNRPLTYSYTTTAGQLTANGPTAKLATGNLGVASITVTCSAVDDMGQSAKASTEITLSKPAAPVIPQTQEMCSLSFNRDRRRPVRVNNEAKGCLDDIGLTMTSQPDARLVVIGNTSPDERPAAAAERALNARDYLTHEKGVDASRIELRVGTTSGRTVRDVLVPTGATFLDNGTQSFDESTIHRTGEAYGRSGASRAAARGRHRRPTQP